MSRQIDAMIIGVEKAGTTALFRHLAQSPHVHTHSQREMFGFLSDEEFERGWDYIWEKYFSSYSTGLVLAKNVMQLNSLTALERLKEQSPDVKCIVMLREPAARAYSAYNYAVLRGAEECATFEDALALEEERFLKDSRPSNPLLYVNNSTYAHKIEMTLNIFGKEKILFIYHEEYKKEPHKQLKRVEAFLDCKLFDGVEIAINSYNCAAKARSPWLAKKIYRLLQSKNPIKTYLRAMLPHDKATTLRHLILNLNRVETPYRKMNEETAVMISRKLADDKKKLVELLGYCPW